MLIKHLKHKEHEVRTKSAKGIINSHPEDFDYVGFNDAGSENLTFSASLNPIYYVKIELIPKFSSIYWPVSSIPG